MTDQNSNEALKAQLDAISGQLDRLVRQQEYYSELISEMAPITKEMMGVGSSYLAGAEKRGYFMFAKQMAQIADTVVTSYDEDDLKQLGDNVVFMIDTVRSFTQPDVLAIANEATAALKDGTDKAPKSLFGMLKASRHEDVRRGMAVMLNVLKHVGRAAKDIRPKRSPKMRRLEAKLAPSGHRARLRLPAPTEKAPAKPAAKPIGKTKTPAIAIDGFAMTGEGFLEDVNTWTQDYATAVAAAVGYELNETHWKLVEWVRADYAEHGASPNVRRIGKNSPVTTKELYGLFPRAPALEAARLAGLPKPVGCI